MSLKRFRPYTRPPNSGLVGSRIVRSGLRMVGIAPYNRHCAFASQNPS
jgi:hypothetical protein